MEVLTGHKEVKQAAFQLAEWGVKEVLITLEVLARLFLPKDVSIGFRLIRLKI